MVPRDGLGELRCHLTFVVSQDSYEARQFRNCRLGSDVVDGGRCTEEVKITLFLFNLSCNAMEVVFGSNISDEGDNFPFQMLQSANLFPKTGGHTV